jgi:hypothetical protein
VEQASRLLFDDVEQASRLLFDDVEQASGFLMKKHFMSKNRQDACSTNTCQN